jgi:hypothetical protein
MNQRAINYKLGSELVAPFPRRLLRLFGLIVSVYVMVVFAIDDSLNPLWGILFAGVGLAPLFIYSKRRRRYYTPLIFTVFYFLGYLLSFSHVLLNKNDMPRSGFGAIGNFMFTDSNFFIVMLVVTAGMGGILTSTLIAEKIFRHRRGIVRKNVKPSFLPKKQLYAWIGLWFCFSICLILLMWHLEIGRTGLEGKTGLPFRLAGFFVYLRGIFIPFFGMLLLDICLRDARKRIASLVLILLIVIGIFSSLGAASRGAFAFTVFPAILFLLFTSRKNNLSQRLFVRFSVIGLIVGCVVMFSINIVRGFAYANVSWSLTDALTLLTNIESADFDFFEIVSNFMGLLTGRIGGIRELMAVIGSDVSGIEIPVKAFMGMISDDIYISIFYSVFGFIVPSGGGIAFGVTCGMWGGLFLSKSYFVVYLGTAFLVGIVICFEEVFLRKGVYSIALLISIVVSFQFWGGATMFFLSRFAVLLLICYLTTLYFLKKMRKASLRAAKVSIVALPKRKEEIVLVLGEGI